MIFPAKRVINEKKKSKKKKFEWTEGGTQDLWSQEYSLLM